MTNNCPACRRKLYSRRLKNCGYCGAPIPEELRFSAEEIAKLDAEMKAMYDQRKMREARAEKEERERRQQCGEIGFLDLL